MNSDDLITDFKKLGCPEQIAALTYQVYQDLCINKKLSNVNYYFNDTLERMYLTSKQTETELVFIPVSSMENISLQTLKQFFNIHNNTKEISLVITNPDSTCVYYNLTNGLLDVTTLGTNRKNRNDKLVKNEETDSSCEEQNVDE